MITSKTSQRSGFDCTIRPAPSGAGRTTPSQPGHYPLNDKLQYKMIRITTKATIEKFVFLYVQHYYHDVFKEISIKIIKK